MENALVAQESGNNPFQSKSVVPGGTMQNAMVTKQAEEVRMQMWVAKQFPRDQYESWNNIMQACERKTLAEIAMYEYPRGGQKVTGPSINLAKAIAQAWGNISYGIIELDSKNGESTMKAYAHDLQTNTRSETIFNVKHERVAKGVKKQLDDPRDVYEMNANMGARRLRACIMNVIPTDVIEAAVDKCKKTLASGHDKPLSDRIRDAIQYFQTTFSVTKPQIETVFGYHVDSFTETDFIRLQNIARQINSGESKREDFFHFDAPATKTDVKSNAEEEFKAAQGGSKDATEQSELPLG